LYIDGQGNARLYYRKGLDIFDFAIPGLGLKDQVWKHIGLVFTNPPAGVLVYVNAELLFTYQFNYNNHNQTRIEIGGRSVLGGQ
jgi:hypothetical protein